MSDLVGNPEDRFSHNEAHFNFCFTASQDYFIHTELSQLTPCLWLRVWLATDNYIFTVVILQRQFEFRHLFRCYSKITFK